MPEERQKSLQMWWAYHRKWAQEWWTAVKAGKTKDLMLSLGGSGIGGIYGWTRGWITRGHFLEFMVVAIGGYIALLVLTWMWHGLFIASKRYCEQESEICKLRTELDVKTEEWIAAQEEALDAHKKDLKTHEELVKALEELAQAGKTISNSSDAFHAQYAETNRLRGELAKWQNVGIKNADPQIYAEFFDDRGSTPNKASEAYIGLINRGGSSALNVCIDPIQLKDTIIKFPRLAYLVEPGKAKYRYPDITTSDNRTPNHKDVFSHIAYEYITYHGLSAPEMSLPLSVTYQDAERNLYEARCELVFDPAAHSRVRTQGQNGSFVVLKTRNHQFKKIALAVE